MRTVLTVKKSYKKSRTNKDLVLTWSAPGAETGYKASCYMFVTFHGLWREELSNVAMAQLNRPAFFVFILIQSIMLTNVMKYSTNTGNFSYTVYTRTSYV